MWPTSFFHRTIGGGDVCSSASRVDQTMVVLRTDLSAVNGVECKITKRDDYCVRANSDMYIATLLPLRGSPSLGALPFFALPLPSTQIGSISKQILSSETKKSRTVPNLASTACVRALECVYRPNTVPQIARYEQVPRPGAKSTSCSSTTRAISYKLVLAVLPKLTNSKSGLQSDPQEPIQSSRYR
ncbi:hypothetical protein TNCV_915961 [Trichonephila clavipes]|nr:hypothetical protein TNCV_915961 [Trichonephila clavipes]